MTAPLPASVGGAALWVLTTADPWDKARRTRRLAEAWRAGNLDRTPGPPPPDRPARPAHPVLYPPRAMPKRSPHGLKGRVALLHALAHIELNAIDLAWDLLARWEQGQPDAFVDDWVRVATEEADHFLALADRLTALGAAYGDLPAHDGLWRSAAATAHDLAARLAVVPMTLEARGLDTTPATIAGLTAAGDADSAAVLTTIAEDEVSHVAAGVRWFHSLHPGPDAGATYRDLLARYFSGRLKPPFNVVARRRAGLPDGYYQDPGTSSL